MDTYTAGQSVVTKNQRSLSLSMIGIKVSENAFFITLYYSPRVS